MKLLLTRFLADETGGTAVEYGLIAGMIACALITAVRHIGTNLSTKLNAVANNLT